MSDALNKVKSGHGGHAGATGGAGTDMRDRVRKIIRAEVARLNPIDDARGPLELIVETSVRYPLEGDEAAPTVVDEKGQPRTKVRDGRVTAFTIADLVEELRSEHPTLFKPDATQRTNDLEEQIGVEGGGPVEAKPVAESDQDLERDWLLIGDLDGIAPYSGDAVRESDRVREGAVPWDALRESSRVPAFLDRLRDHVHERGGSLALATFAGAALLLAIVYAGYPRIARSPAPEPARQEVAATPAAPATPTAPDVPVATGTLPNAEPSVEDARLTDTGPLRGVSEVLDTATLYIQGKIVRLYGVEWVRGAGEPEELARYLSGREVVCEPTGTPEYYRCEVGGQDLSKVVLYNGGGKATSDAPSELLLAQARAQSARVGVWGKNQNQNTTSSQ